ncbi:MAG: 6-hydroxycyclohex-1-ene-1-carbonyl-CoA dehydrogenase [Bacteroidota bacterium]|nr:6-hydroxycyclohex-1-ene-1-carbonyl-CoA dehydrogenase [Bacteroidota bacterium]MDP4233218.1 6-hydroxycyclohex-1-ene-1-carbonyl-CoA dehydrogenase [Bacteroidota bacterium]MDP4242163.1 6-hydroxycyclohex-1-ene-1-carbonyl-CoA dehydrogenase [Bacteroidota bacterium]MDP4287813.1 6-hydroxycyclohex-1-ene-1-carbonyl-CoA dehydrogenase [Bacteroidota bacterium]
MAKTLSSWRMVARDADLVQTSIPIPTLAAGEALIKIAGCGVCHTDIGFWHDGVATRHALPLTLGHEISGVVEDGPTELIGRSVIIPAVLPCGECELCTSGRSNICRNQKMPGNDFDGGFASHITVPARFLCPVPERLLQHHDLATLSVIADAVATPYQAVRKSGLVAGDLAIVVGIGGVGIYGALIAKLYGGKVLAIDISDERLASASAMGIPATLNTSGLELKAIKSKVRELATKLGTPTNGWKIFEFSGTKAGQELAFNLMSYASTVSIVGFTMDKMEVRLSNLMAFDATMIGTWACKPELYPEILDLFADGRLTVEPFVEKFPMDDINQIFHNTLAHKYTKRSVLVPNGNPLRP